ncbi:NAD(P)/FAD-dependent oxidoreductase [Streptomyces sp. NPDC021093]|uniref:NAD(P)/FAD-dependent oxidoreductase n=1 Tax=Streptomyces sp. NPDC021093 TaxID=3365112 RepID=UPI00378C9B10
MLNPTEVPQSTDATQSPECLDVVVIGGGAAGLSAALVLGRSRRSVLVVDAGQPRNAPAAHMQGYLGRDGMPPGEFLAVGRQEVQRYGVRLTTDEVTDITAHGDGESDSDGGDSDGIGDFDVHLRNGPSVHARRIVVATGLVDELPDIPGLAERWGRDVLHCPYCHGWEVRDRAFGVLAHPTLGAHQALLLTQWSQNITLFLHDVTELPDSQRAQLKAAGIPVVEGPVAALVVAKGTDTDTSTATDMLTGLRLAQGDVVPLDVLFAAGRPVPRDTLLRRLGARTVPTPVGPYPEVDPTGRTSVPGVWAVGNAAGPTEQVINAASAGYRAGVTINAELTFLDLGR